MKKNQKNNNNELASGEYLSSHGKKREKKGTTAMVADTIQI